MCMLGTKKLAANKRLSLIKVHKQLMLIFAYAFGKGFSGKKRLKP